jgi:hypothetical protein
VRGRLHRAQQGTAALRPVRLSLDLHARRVPDAGDLDQVVLGLDPIHDATRFADDLTNRWLVEFGNDPTGLEEPRQPLDGAEQASSKRTCRDGIAGSSSAM